MTARTFGPCRCLMCRTHGATTLPAPSPTAVPYVRWIADSPTRGRWVAAGERYWHSFGRDMAAALAWVSAVHFRKS